MWSETWYAGKANMSKEDKRPTVGVEELALANSLTLTAMEELLEERGIVSKD